MYYKLSNRGRIDEYAGIVLKDILDIAYSLDNSTAIINTAKDYAATENLQVITEEEYIALKDEFRQARSKIQTVRAQ